MMKTNRSKPRTLRLDHETAVAMDDACEWMRAVSDGLLSESPKARVRLVNLLLRATLEAVMNYESRPGSQGKLCWPLAFTARERTAEEMERHELLRTAAAQSDEAAELAGEASQKSTADKTTLDALKSGKCICDYCAFHHHFPKAITTPNDCFHCHAAAAARGGPASRQS